MGRRQTRITDLPADLLKHIIKLLAGSLAGDAAADVARAMTISKVFKELAKDEDILKVVNFSKHMLHPCDDEPFWQRIGLLVSCARVGNELAMFLLFLKIDPPQEIKSLQREDMKLQVASYISDLDKAAELKEEAT